MKNSTAIILLLLSIGLFYTFTNGQYQDVKKLRALSSEYRKVLQDVSDITEIRDRLLVTYETFPRAEIDRINKVLPDNINIVQLALDLDGMASRHGISIESIQAEVDADNNVGLIVLPENAEVYEKATVSLSFVSNYENFTRLLAEIEKSLRIMDIKLISFQTSESGFYQYKISVKTYWLK
ncbi:MAG: type 4a pilus biogenesis protein PilO [Patescibacteria group bacterium]|nr:type 4a pilus biogenesis protein PilO [Patescibacteria group bacterium]